MKKLTELAIILVLFGISSFAQEVRNEVTIQGSGFFNKQTTESGITNEPTNSGGMMAGYRFNLKNWLAIEGDYDYFRDRSDFSSSSSTTFIPMNVHAATGTAVVKLPSFKALQHTWRQDRGSIRARWRRSHVLRSARGIDEGANPRCLRLWRWFRCAAGKTFPRAAQYRGFVFKTPDFR